MHLLTFIAGIGIWVLVVKYMTTYLTCTTNYICVSMSLHSAAVGEFMHPCEDEIVCKCTTDENKVPYFNAPVYLENKEQIGKVDEIFGQLRDFVSFLLSFQSLNL